MPRPLTPAEAAARLKKWADVGIDYALVEGTIRALDVDKRESVARAPRRSGRLASTIRVLKPSSRSAAAKKGQIRAQIKAGSSSSGNRVLYASVLQTGKVGYPPKDRTARHLIAPQRFMKSAGGYVRMSGRLYVPARDASALRFIAGGRPVFTRRVMHPGSRFRADNYLRVNEPRLIANVEAEFVKPKNDPLGAA